MDVAHSDIKAGLKANTAFVTVGLCESGSAGRRLIREGGARINGKVINDEWYVIRTDDIGDDGRIKLSAGKKRHALIRPA